MMNFDYTAITASVADTLRAAADRIRGRLRSAVADTGADLIAVKERLDHGRFLQWIAAEFGMSERSAQNYMNAARFLKDKPATLADLPPTVLYALAAPTTPPALVEEVEAAAAAGTPLPLPDLRTKLADVADAARRAKTQARKSPDEIAKEKKKKAIRLARAQRDLAAREAARQAEEVKALAAVQNFVKRFGAAAFQQMLEIISTPGWYEIDKHFRRIDAGVHRISTVAEISAELLDSTVTAAPDLAHALAERIDALARGADGTP